MLFICIEERVKLMAYTGIINDRRLARVDRNMVLTARYDYQPVEGIGQTDASDQFATTAFVANYSNPIINIAQTNGTIKLDENKFYKVSLNGTTTFSLPQPKNLGVKNQIKVYLRLNSANLQINWGTGQYLAGNSPLVYKGNYILFYDWNPNTGTWSVGSLVEGKVY